MPTFFADAYGRIRAVLDNPPIGLSERAGSILREFEAERWLNRYLDLAGLADTFERMSSHLSRRFGRRVDFTPLTPALPGLLDLLDADFNRFYPDLQTRLR